MALATQLSPFTQLQLLAQDPNSSLTGAFLSGVPNCAPRAYALRSWAQAWALTTQAPLATQPSPLGPSLTTLSQAQRSPVRACEGLELKCLSISVLDPHKPI